LRVATEWRTLMGIVDKAVLIANITRREH